MAEDKNEEGSVNLGISYPGSDPMEKAKYEVDLNFAEEITDEQLDPPETTAETTTEEQVSESETDDTTEETTETTEEDGETEETVEPEETEVEEAAELEDTTETEKVEEVEQVEEPEAKKPMVPKSRLDEVLAKTRKLQEQIDALTAEKEAPAPDPAPQPYDFDAKELLYQDHVLNGETEKAVALRKEIRAAEKTQLEYEMGQKFNQHTTQNQQLNELQIVANEMEAKYPIFSKNSEDFNETYTNEVVELRDAFVNNGSAPAEALKKAVNYVVKTYNIDAPEEKTETSTLSEQSKQPAPKQVDQVAKKRKEVKKKLKAAESQPPDMPGESSAAHGEKTVDIASMSEDEFNALPEATLKRLRGDIG